MSLIRIVLTIGCMIYGALFAVELIQGHILWQAVFGAGALALLAGLVYTREEEMLHQGENTALWICILLFGLYAILRSGGLI